MKYLLLFCSFILSMSVWAQSPPQKINANYQFRSVGADSGGLRLPKYHLLPGNPTGVYIDSGAIAYNFADSSQYEWTGSQWIKVGPIRPAPPPLSIQWTDGKNFRSDTTLLFDSATLTMYNNNEVVGKKQGGQYSKTLRTARLFDSSWESIDRYPTLQNFGDFERGLDQTFVNIDGHRDATLFDCYNCDAPGSPRNPAEPEFDRTMESHFVGTGIEFYDQFVYPNGDRVRPFGYNMSLGSADNNIFFPHFDQYEFFDERGGTPVMSFRKDGHFRLIGQIPECTFGLTDSATSAGIFVVAHNSTDLGTQISSQADATHFAPTSIYWGLNVQGSLNEAVWSIESATSAGYNMSQDTTNYLVDPPALLASFAYILPGFARDGQVVDIYAGGQVASGPVVTSFTVVPNVGFGQTLISNISLSGITLMAGQHFRLKYQALNSRWYNSN